MTDFNKRVGRIENALNATSGDRYRELCLAYNLTFLSDDDLHEMITATLEGRRPNPETEKRAYAPIPIGSPPDLVRQAELRLSNASVPSDSDLEQLLMHTGDYSLWI